MSKLRLKAAIVFAALCGGLTALIFYGSVMNFSFGLVRAHVSNPWVIGSVMFLISILVFGLSIGILISQYRHAVSKCRIDVVSALVFFIGGMFSLYGGSLFALSLLGLVVQILGTI